MASIIGSASTMTTNNRGALVISRRFDWALIDRVGGSRCSPAICGVMGPQGATTLLDDESKAATNSLTIAVCVWVRVSQSQQCDEQICSDLIASAYYIDRPLQAMSKATLTGAVRTRLLNDPMCCISTAASSWHCAWTGLALFRHRLRQVG